MCPIWSTGSGVWSLLWSVLWSELRTDGVSADLIKQFCSDIIKDTSAVVGHQTQQAAPASVQLYLHSILWFFLTTIIWFPSHLLSVFPSSLLNSSEVKNLYKNRPAVLTARPSTHMSFFLFIWNRFKSFRTSFTSGYSNTFMFYHHVKQEPFLRPSGRAICCYFCIKCSAIQFFYRVMNLGFTKWCVPLGINGCILKWKSLDGRISAHSMIFI